MDQHHEADGRAQADLRLPAVPRRAAAARAIPRAALDPVGREVMVSGCTSHKSKPLVKGFFSHVMYSARFGVLWSTSDRCLGR
jgi:hypothetical protein